MLDILEVLNEYNIINKEFIVTVFTLYFIGYLIKKSNLNDAYIPLLLMIVSLIINLFKQTMNTELKTLAQLLLIFVKCFQQGCFETMTAVYINQLLKQKNKK